jgi:3-oxoacyl-[acyl-carrier protein] reductase
MIDPGLDGKVAIVTGANHGIGAATARALASQGARLFITYYRPETTFKDSELEEAKKKGVGGDALYAAMQQQSGQTVVESIVELGGVAVEHELDLGRVENIERLFDLCEGQLDPVDILINNHTHFQADTFVPVSMPKGYYDASTIEAEVIDRHFAVNARACALLMREYLRRHIERGSDWGRIVNLTTVLGHPRAVSYAASKRALVSYSMSAAEEMGKYGITVNVVCPGATQTGYITPENEPHIVERTPLGRLGYSEDVADVITFLVSEQGHWLTGQLVYASGGFLTYLSER